MRDVSPTSVDPRHDLVHTPDPDRERWRESYYFQFVDFRHGIGGYHGPGYRPRKGYTGVLHVLWGHDFGTLAATEKGRYAQHDAVHPVGGFQWEIVEPLKTWRIRFDGALNDGGRDPAVPVEAVVAVADAPGRTVPVSYDLVFDRDKPAYIYDANPAWDGLFDGHIDEVGTVKGTMRIGDRTFDVDGRGSKDHSWGARDWSKPKGWRWVDMLFEEGPELTVWRATFDGTTWLDDGAIYVDADTAEKITSFSEAVTFTERPRADRPASWEFDVASENHRIRGRGEMISVAPLLFPFRTAAGTRGLMWNDRTVFRCELDDGRVGYGSAEFQFHAPQDGGRAPRPLLAGGSSA
jgi:hypothetical protein